MKPTKAENEGARIERAAVLRFARQQWKCYAAKAKESAHTAGMCDAYGAVVTLIESRANRVGPGRRPPSPPSSRATSRASSDLPP